MNETESKIKPKQYSHIDYEALLIYTMKRHISLERAIEENGLTIARSTVIRNIRKMKKEKGKNLDIINFYQDVYVPKYQTPELPEEILRAINELPDKNVVIKGELDDLYRKLSIMNQIVEACNGNITKATEKINSGQTPLGKNKPITIQGLAKDIKYFKKTREFMEAKIKEERKGEEK